MTMASNIMVSVNAYITTSAPPSPRLSRMILRYQKAFLLDHGGFYQKGLILDNDGFDEIHVDVEDIDESLNQQTSYAYNITAKDTSLYVTADTIYGVGYALETLSQMLSKERTLPASFTVVDSPAYNHRGFMIDTGRRFVPLNTILNNLDAMAMTKLNILHLHFADWCRFAIESDYFPQLTSTLTDDQSGFYTKEEVQQMI